MDSSSDWRFKTHLANLPVYYEYKDEGIDSTEAIKGTYLDNYKQIFDLYINNATCDPSLLSSKTGEDAASEFALGEAVFYQNGTWAYTDIQGNAVSYTHLDVYKRQSVCNQLLCLDNGLVQGGCLVHSKHWREFFVCKLLADIYGLYLTNENLGLLGNRNTCQVCNGVSGLAYDLGVERAVDNNGLAHLIQLLAF